MISLNDPLALLSTRRPWAQIEASVAAITPTMCGWREPVGDWTLGYSGQRGPRPQATGYRLQATGGRVADLYPTLRIRKQTPLRFKPFASWAHLLGRRQVGAKAEFGYCQVLCAALQTAGYAWR